MNNEIINDINLIGTYYYIDNSPNGFSSSCLNLCTTDDDKIVKYSNDWLYLLNNGPDLNNIYNIIKNNKNTATLINENVIPIITTFIGSIHGYAGIFSILEQYMNNLDLYKNYKIIVYKNIHKGILDIINFLFKDKDIIYIDHNIIYKFNKIYIIPNRLHSYFESVEISKKIIYFIDKYLIDKYLIDNKICIIKHANSCISSTHGILSFETAQFIANKYNHTLIEPSNYNEIDLINILYNCKSLILSWGTTFMKNFIYISNLCENITVLIIGDAFVNEYNYLKNNNKLISHFKNAKFTYIELLINTTVN